jgi:hypothetical protein
MVRGVLKEHVDFRAFLRALAPFLAAQWLLLLAVLFVPQLAHPGKPAEENSRAAPAALSDDEFNRRLNEMIKLPEPETDAAPERR